MCLHLYVNYFIYVENSGTTCLTRWPSRCSSAASPPPPSGWTWTGRRCRGRRRRPGRPRCSTRRTCSSSARRSGVSFIQEKKCSCAFELFFLHLCKQLIYQPIDVSLRGMPGVSFVYIGYQFGNRCKLPEQKKIKKLSFQFSDNGRAEALRRLESAHYIYPLGGAGGADGAVLRNSALRYVAQTQQFPVHISLL